MAQFLLMLVMIVSALLLSALSVSAASDSEKAVGAPGGGSAGRCVVVSQADQHINDPGKSFWK